MTGGGEEIVLGKCGLEEDSTHPYQGEGGASFKGRGAGGAALWIGDLGGHPYHGQGPVGVSGPGDETPDGTSPVEDTGRDLDTQLGVEADVFWSLEERHVTIL